MRDRSPFRAIWMMSASASLLLAGGPAASQPAAAPPPQPAAAGSPACVPACRTGFMCVDGACVSACNPPCAHDEYCTARGECQISRGATEDDDEGRTFGLSAVGGYLLPGTVDVEGYEVDTEAGWVGRLAVDGYVIPQLSMGAYALMAKTSPERSSEDATIKAFGGTLKGAFGSADSFQVRVGLAVAYQMEQLSDDGPDDIKGFGIAPIVEGAIPVSPEVNILLHGSFISQPAGGNDDVSVSFAPIVYLGGGIEFAK